VDGGLVDAAEGRARAEGEVGGAQHFLVDRDESAELGAGVRSDPDLGDRAAVLASRIERRELFSMFICIKSRIPDSPQRND
jgi:hypothetical protein